MHEIFEPPVDFNISTSDSCILLLELLKSFKLLSILESEASEISFAAQYLHLFKISACTDSSELTKLVEHLSPRSKIRCLSNLLEKISIYMLVGAFTSEFAGCCILPVFPIREVMSALANACRMNFHAKIPFDSESPEAKFLHCF